MNREKLLKSGNLALLAVMAIQLLTGIAMKLHLEFGHEVVEEVHEINGIILGAFVLVHIYLNWGWIKHNYLARN